MKKSLIAAAALTAIAGAAQAQTVTMYGLVDMGYNMIESTVGSTTTKQNTLGWASANGDGGLNGSRLGFRGTEDLGGGLTAGFVLEAGIRATSSRASEVSQVADAPASLIGAGVRQGYVSLADAKLGTLNVGTQYAQYDSVGSKYDAAGGPNLTGTNHANKLGQTARNYNAITYVSPKFSGVSASVTKGVAENTRSGAVSDKANDQTIYAIAYDGGKLQADYVRSTIKNTYFAASTALFDVINTGTAAVEVGSPVGSSEIAASAHVKSTLDQMGASYDFGFAKVMVQSNKTKYTGVADDKLEGLGYGFTAPVGANASVGLGFTDGKVVDNGVKTYDISAYSLVGVYNLSKRTNVYIYNGQVKYDLVAAGNDVKQKVTSVGMRHSF